MWIRLFLLTLLPVYVSAWELRVVSSSNNTDLFQINCSSGNLTHAEQLLCDLYSDKEADDCPQNSTNLCTVYVSKTLQESHAPLPITRPVIENGEYEGMTPGHVAAVVLCVLLSVGIVALAVVLYALNQRQKSYMNSLDRTKTNRMVHSESKTAFTNIDIEKAGEINPAFEVENEEVYYSPVPDSNHIPVIKPEQDTKLNSAPPTVSGEHNNNTTDQGFVEDASQDVYEPVDVVDDQINMRGVSTRKFQKKNSKDDLHQQGDDKKPAAAIRQDTLYDEPWDSNMISVVIDSVINHHQAHQRETEHLSQVLEEENRGEV